MSSMDDLIGAGGDIIVTTDASAEINDLIALGPDGKGWPVKTVGTKTWSGVSGSGYKRTKTAGLTGGNIVATYPNVSGYPAMRILSPAGKELTGEIVLTTSFTIHTASSDFSIVAMSNGNFAVLHVYGAAGYIYLGIYGPTGTPVFPFARIDTGAVVWRNEKLRLFQLPNGNLVIVGCNQTGYYPAGMLVSETGAVLKADQNLDSVYPLSTPATFDAIGSKTNNNFGVVVMTNSGNCRYYGFDTNFTKIDAGTSDPCTSVAIAASDDGYIWHGFINNTATYAAAAYRHSPTNAGSYQTNTQFLYSPNSMGGSLAMSCTSNNHCVFSVGSPISGAAVGIAILRFDATSNYLFCEQALSWYSATDIDQGMVGGQTVIASNASGIVASGRIANGDVLVAMSRYSGFVAGAKGAITIFRVHANGTVASKRVTFDGYQYGGSYPHMDSLTGANKHLLAFTMESTANRPGITLVPIAPVIGVLASSGRVSKNGKCTTSNAAWMPGTTMNDVPSLVNHQAKVAFANATDLVVG